MEVIDAEPELPQATSLHSLLLEDFASVRLRRGSLTWPCEPPRLFVVLERFGSRLLDGAVDGRLIRSDYSGLRFLQMLLHHQEEKPLLTYNDIGRGDIQVCCTIQYC